MIVEPIQESAGSLRHSAHGQPRILVVHPSDERYGADRMLLQVVDALAERGISLEVWLPNDLAHGPFPLCDELAARGIPFEHVELPVLRRANLTVGGLARTARSAARLRHRIRERNVQHVHCGTSACLLVAPVARLAGVRSVSVHLQEVWTGAEGRVLRALARATTVRVAISEAVAGAARLSHPPAVVIENCVQPATAAEPADVSPLRRPHYVVASRWNSWKGHATLLRAWELAGFPGHLTVLGGPPPSGSSVDVPGLVAALEHPETVSIVGEVPEVAPYLAACDALLQPSDSPEPFGLTIIEAFSAGRPAIASRAGGPLRIIEDGRTGWLYPIGDAEALADLLKGLTVAELATAGRRAADVYMDRYTPGLFRSRIGDLFEQALARPS